MVGRFLAAARAGDVDRLLAVLAPDVVRTADATALPPGVPGVLRGARPVAEGTALLAGRSRMAELALIDGAVGLAVVQNGRLQLAVAVSVVDGLVAAYDVIADPDRLRGTAVAVLAIECE